MATTTELKPSGMAHILLDDRGRGWIEGTRVRVDQVVADVIGPEKMTPERVIEEYPDSGLTLENIAAAMAWYRDHQAEMDDQFARELAMVEAAREDQRKRPQFQKILALKAAREAAGGRPQD
jgi:uncharacterized protein (DUF433 family)